MHRRGLPHSLQSLTQTREIATRCLAGVGPWKTAAHIDDLAFKAQRTRNTRRCLQRTLGVLGQCLHRGHLGAEIDMHTIDGEVRQLQTIRRTFSEQQRLIEAELALHTAHRQSSIGSLLRIHSQHRLDLHTSLHGQLRESCSIREALAGKMRHAILQHPRDHRLRFAGSAEDDAVLETCVLSRQQLPIRGDLRPHSLLTQFTGDGWQRIGFEGVVEP